MRRAFWTAICAAVGWTATMVVVQPALAAELCVGTKPGCFSAIQAAVDAAKDGDTIRVGPGTFPGGITILKNLELVGTSAGATVIRGGGPVITIGEFMGPQPTVSISRVTITGGLNDSAGVAAGGGVTIAFAGPGLPGATVSIEDSVITGNRATPDGLLPPGPFCGPAPCAVAWGGGIDNSGALTLTDTRVTDNVAGATANGSSDATIAEGGGIRSHPGATLTIRRSVVSDNRAATTLPNGRFAFGGGIGDDGVLTVEDSAIDGNSVDATSSVGSSIPFGIEQEAGGGGLSSDGSATIMRSSVSGNGVSASNAGGDAQAVSGGIDADGVLLLVDSSVAHNTVTANVPPFSGLVAGAVFGGLEVGIGAEATVRSSRIAHNTLAAFSMGGGANVAGAGIANLSGRLTLERTLVTGNRGRADGATGLPAPLVGGGTLGGGILNIDFGGGPPQLIVADSVITANALVRRDAITPAGGGIFSADLFSGAPVPFTLTRSVVAGNKPDQCVGC